MTDVAGATAALHGAIAALAALGTTAASWSGTERAALVTSLDRAVTDVTALRAAFLLVERESGEWKRAGDPSFEAWRARTSRSGMRAAVAEVRRADTLAAMPEVSAAVTSGELSLEHVDVVARTATGASAPVRRALASPEGRAELLALARRTDAGRFATRAAQWSAGVDRAGLERTHQAQRAARFLHLTETPGGTRVAGLLDTMAGHRLRLALEAVTGKPAPDDERTSEQRRADALEAIAGSVLAQPPAVEGPTGRRPHVAMTMSVETWAALRALGRGGAAAEPPADDAGPVPPASLEDGTPVPSSELARTLCDCELTRVVIGADSVPLDLGRTVRTHSPAQRRGVTARDGGCLWPGCGTPARWCEVHHLAWWDRDSGPTSVRDGALACSFHHHAIHRLDLVVTRVTVPGTQPGLRTTAYVISTPGGRLIADGRPVDPGGGETRVLDPGDGEPVRTWLPRVGGVDGVPEQLRDALGTPGPPPRAPVRALSDAAVSVGPGSLQPWRSS